MAFSLKIGACLLIIWANYLLPADENNLYQVQEEQSLDDFLLCADAKKSVNSGSDEVLKRFKDNSLKKINAWIDGIAPSSDLPFLHKNVLVGADGEPKDHSRDSFKSALSECVGNFRVEDVSKNKRIKKIRLVEFINFHEQLMDVLIKKLNSFIEELLPYDGLFLNPSLFSNISADHVSCKRDSFALSMQLAIMT